MTSFMRCRFCRKTLGPMEYEILWQGSAKSEHEAYDKTQAAIRQRIAKR